MSTSEAGINLIKSFEGCSLKPYLCPAGLPTIGWGHLIKPKEAAKFAAGITQEQADTLLLLDLAITEQAVDRLINVPLNGNQFDSLVSFIFNLGAQRLQAGTLRQKLNRGDYEGAAAEFSKWIWGGGKKLPGLIRRREAERALFCTPMPQQSNWDILKWMNMAS